MARAVWFVGPRTASLRDEEAIRQADDELVVETIASGISQGTETLIYRGEGPTDQVVTPSTCIGKSMGSFPIKYGYACVGKVAEAGPASGYSVGDTVFCRHPHQDRFVVRADNALLYPVPEYANPEIAVFGNLLEVATNALLDTPVRHGDVVVVFGLGVVGLFIAQLAARTAAAVVGVDPLPFRRKIASNIGVDVTCAPDEVGDVVEQLSGGRGTDVVFEASGAPSALQYAIDVTGFEGTVTVVSWYGAKEVPLRLSPSFHMKRQRLVSSQVNVVGSGLQPRWDHVRRMESVWRLLPNLHPEQLITHRFVLDQAQEAFDIFDDPQADALAVVLTYDHDLSSGSDHPR